LFFEEKDSGCRKTGAGGIEMVWAPPMPEVSVCTMTRRPVVYAGWESFKPLGAGCVCTYVDFTVLQSP
jgi:hypothetical protein